MKELSPDIRKEVLCEVSALKGHICLFCTLLIPRHMCWSCLVWFSLLWSGLVCLLGKKKRKRKRLLLVPLHFPPNPPVTDLCLVWGCISVFRDGSCGLVLSLCQLHHLVSDDVCLKVVELYLNEQQRGAAGGNLSSRCVRAARETSYQWKAERCMADENCFKVRHCRVA